MPRISQTWNRDVWCLFLMLLPLATMQNLWNVSKLGVAPSHHLLIYSRIFGFWLGLQLLPRECSTYSRGVLEDFLGIPPFQLCFEVTCSHFWGLRHLFLHFWVWVCRCSHVYAPSIPMVFWWIFCKTCNFSNLLLDLQPSLGLRHLFLPFLGLVGFACSPQCLVDFLGIPPFQSAVFWGDLQPILGVAPSIPVFNF